MYSLPSASQTWLPFPRTRYFGAKPRTNCDGPFDSVCGQGLNKVSLGQLRGEMLHSQQLGITVDELADGNKLGIEQIL